MSKIVCDPLYAHNDDVRKVEGVEGEVYVRVYLHEWDYRDTVKRENEDITNRIHIRKTLESVAPEHPTTG